jgi:hypothetical protein
MKRGLTTNVNVRLVVMVCTLNLLLVHMITIEPYSHNAQAQAPSVTNQTSSQSTSQPEISMLEKKIVPAQETTVIVNQTTLSVSPQILQPLQEIQNETQNFNP